MYRLEHYIIVKAPTGSYAVLFSGEDNPDCPVLDERELEGLLYGSDAHLVALDDGVPVSILLVGEEGRLENLPCPFVLAQTTKAGEIMYASEVIRID